MKHLIFSSLLPKINASLPLVFFLVFAIQSHGQTPDSRRTSFNENWRFQKSDPIGAENDLSWEKLKEWVKATGNKYVLTIDAVQSARPTGNIGEEVAYTKQDFDDSSWRQMNLPHDWGIEGNFQQELPGETGKRPWAGIGWYRKHFAISQGDKGKRIYIDFDGAMSHSAVWLNGNFCWRLAVWLRLIPARSDTIH
jgi:beta-galactosidase